MFSIVSYRCAYVRFVHAADESSITCNHCFQFNRTTLFNYQRLFSRKSFCKWVCIFGSLDWREVKKKTCSACVCVCVCFDSYWSLSGCCNACRFIRSFYLLVFCHSAIILFNSLLAMFLLWSCNFSIFTSAFECSTAWNSKIPTIFLLFSRSFCVPSSLSNFIYSAFMLRPPCVCASFLCVLCIVWFSMDLYWCVCRRANNQTKNQITPEVEIKLNRKERYQTSFSIKATYTREQKKNWRQK